MMRRHATRSISRLLTIGHSYVIGSNRRLAHELAVQGRGRWEVTAVAPERLRADLRDVTLEPIPGEACAVRALPVAVGSIPHLRFYRGLKRVLNDRWDVVHVWEEPYVASGAQIAMLAPVGARVVPATFQNIVKHYPFPLSAFERRVLDRSAAWIAFGETVHEAQRGKPMYAARPSRVITPGVDVERFRPDPRSRRAVRERLGWLDDTPVVGYLGRFVPEKGLGTLMRALESATQPWRALIVGGGPMLPELTAFSEAHPDRVRVLTGVVHDEVPAHLNAMDLLCAPSETTSRWREQFGRMLIEAMACGVPVIASRSGEIPHVIADVGVLVDERDVVQWTCAVDSLLSNPRTRRDLSARGITRARERFAWPVVARAHLAFFEELL
jgi:glycosyltransferase involved in cell wall biosynthesis